MKRWLVLLIAVSLIGCSQKEFYSKDIYYKGLQAYKNKDLDTAKELLKKAIYKSKGMTTTDIMLARYLLANIYFQKKQYVDAIVEYEEYLTLFPTSPKVPEVLYKLAVSYLKIAPGYERDLTYVRKAEEKVQELIFNYPDSPYAKKAEKLLSQIKQIYIKHYLAVADLYYHLNKYYPAAVFYQLVLDKYGKYLTETQKQNIKKHLIQALSNVDKQYEEEINDYKEKIAKLQKKISEETSQEKKKVLKNRLNLYKQQLQTLLNRIKESKEKAKKLSNS